MSNRMILAALGMFVATATMSSTASAQQKTRGYVLDFSATWCGPCQQVAPVVEKLAREGLPIKSVDVDRHPELKQQFNITSLPTFVLVIDGKVKKRQTGWMPESDIRRMLAAIPAPQPSAPPQLLVDDRNSDQRNAGQRAPHQRAQPKQPIARTANPIRSALLDLPFRRKPKQQAPAPLGKTVVRGNANDSIPALPVARGPMASSVRIKVRVGEQMNFGSGTVIGSTPGRATIATCWHIFRGATRGTKIEVDAFFTGKTETYVAKLVSYDEEADVGIIEVSTDSDWPAVRVASADHAPRADDSVVSIGCGGGEDPTIQPIRITRIDPYNGPSNIECSGVPIRGRSGGGLFNAKGELIGICSAADKQDKRGIYAGLFAVHDILDRAQLTRLYKDDNSLIFASTQQGERRDASDLQATGGAVSIPTGLQTPSSNNAMLAANTPASVSQPSIDEFMGAPSTRPQQSPATPDWANNAFTNQPGASVPASPPAAFNTAANTRSAAAESNDVEIVCIVRSKSKPELGSRVIVIDQSDPRLIEMLREYDRRSQQR